MTPALQPTDAIDQPLVSCIMPTYNRRPFVPHAIRYFQRQEYENKELIIIDDGSDSIEDLLPTDPRIRYFRLDEKISLGAKLNMACELASGQMIANWDDDDWYAPRRLRYQAETLLNNPIDICGISNLLYYDIRSRKAFNYIYPRDHRTWLLGSSLFFRKEFWNTHHFDDINVGMDGLFVWKAHPDRITELPDSSFSVHMIHGSNVSPKQTHTSWWHHFPVEKISEIMNSDWPLYQEGVFSATKNRTQNNIVQKQVPVKPVKLLQNVYACLVHENAECIIDLVRNLHYHDPESKILLYNGGTDEDLLNHGFPFEKFNAIVYPSRMPMKHGYLHHFALHSMAFALEQLDFDILTIVDSDQLSIRSGYTRHISEFFSTRTDVKIGMLSSRPERVTVDNKTNQVAALAFREYDLWKPFLESFEEGPDKFVHWTFWPSTVFTRDAVRDLLELFRENKLLQEIMMKTKIWATEEVILPTLISLLGYEILSNPCSYEFVSYRKLFTAHDLNNAFHNQHAYWVHPVERKYENPLRKLTRQRSNHYVKPSAESRDDRTQDLFLPMEIIQRIKSIEGWLNDHEAELLMAIVLKTCKELTKPFNIVEIGSYHGKSTIVIGSVIKTFSPGTKIYSIDPHDGRQGAADEGIQIYQPSVEMFKRNIENAGLSQIVEMIRDYSVNVRWELPVSLLFIDGLHDYPHVAADFWHFSEWVTDSGHIVFHDFADYYPGVQALVGNCSKREGSLKYGRQTVLCGCKKKNGMPGNA